MEQTISIVLTLFGALGGTAILSGLIMRKVDKMAKKLDTQETARIEESVVIISGIKAIGHLAEATAIAQRDGKTNGVMQDALIYYKESRDGLNDYLVLRSAERTHGR